LQVGDSERYLKAVQYVNGQREKGGGPPPPPPPPPLPRFSSFADLEHEAVKEGGGQVEEEEDQAAPHHGSEPKTFVWVTQNSKAKPYPFGSLV